MKRMKSNETNANVVVTSPQTPSKEEFTLLGPDQLSAAGSRINWLWHGYLAPGNVTVLASQWKSGKTTLVSALLSKLHSGGEFLGLPIRPGKSIIVSEESAVLWQQRRELFDFGTNARWICRPFHGRPTPEQWLRLIDRIARWHAEEPRDLVVIDPLAPFMAGDENYSGSMLDALLPLQQLTSAGLAVLVLHHMRKNTLLDGQAARGSGALSGYADILIEMHWFSRPADDDRRRRLQAYTRYTQTPRQIVIELNAAGNGFEQVANEVEADFAATWQLLQAALADAEKKLTQNEIRNSWPEGSTSPEALSLWRWLTRAVHSGLVLRDGRGLKNDPFRYWLPDSEQRWRDDPLHLPDLPPMRELLRESRDPKKQAELERIAIKEARQVLDREAKRRKGGKGW